jgi:tetratricopeptide (TPR) repeat protein
MELNDWNDAERRVERAQELFEQRKWQEALEELRAATSINPYNAAWYFNIGLTLDEMDRTPEAIEAYRQALEIEPDDVQALNHLGIDLHRVGRVDEALQCFERIETIDCSFEPSYCPRILCYSDLGEHERAEEMFCLGRLYKEHCPQCYFNMGMSLAARGLYDKAIYCWQRTLDAQGSHPEVHAHIAQALWSKGEREHARRHYLAGLRQAPGSMVMLLDLSELLIEMQRWDEAGEKIRRAIELAPEDPAAHYCHGRWLLRCNRDDEAVVSLRRALELDPTFPGAHLRLAEAHYRKGELDPTREHLRAELLLRPEDTRTAMDLANLLMDVGETRAAAACLKRVVQKEPCNAKAWQNLGVAHFLRGRHGEGIAACQEAMRLDPTNLMAVHNLAMALGELRQYDAALATIRASAANESSNAHLEKLELRLRMLRIRERFTGILRTLRLLPGR